MKLPWKRGSRLWLERVWPGGNVDSSRIRIGGFKRSQGKLRLAFFHVDYPNFKSRSGELQDQRDKLPIYVQFWDEMLDHQPRASC